MRMFYVQFAQNERKFVDEIEMRQKWPWTAVRFLEPLIQKKDIGLPNQMGMYIQKNK